MSVQEGFESEDPEVIKKARGTAKGRVTNFVNRLPLMLKKETGGNFRHDQIDEADVSDVRGELAALPGPADQVHGIQGGIGG